MQPFVLCVHLRECKLNNLKSAKKRCPASSNYGPCAVFLFLQNIAVFFASDSAECLFVVMLNTGNLNLRGFINYF